MSRAPCVDAFFNDMYGGPCPICGFGGELLRHKGTYGAGATHEIVHQAEGGQIMRCVIPKAGWILSTVEGTWHFFQA